MDEVAKQQIAEISGYPGFRLLVELFRQHEVGLVADVAAATCDADVLRASRRYQTFRYVREFLEAQPLAAEQALADLTAKQEAWDSMPTGIDQLIHSRYERNFHEEGERA